MTVQAQGVEVPALAVRGLDPVDLFLLPKPPGATAARATPCPARRRANRYTGTADAARASAITTPSMRGSGHTQ